MEPATPYVMYLIAAPVDAAPVIARTLVEERAAACAQVTQPVTSYFHWEGKLRRETEALILVKTVRSRREQIQRVIRDHHPYQVPELIEIPLTGGNESYFRWLDGELSGEARPVPPGV